MDGERAWYNAHGDHLGGKRIPLGAYVHFSPTHKIAPRSMRGVFAGYESGMRWSGKMLVWDLEKFLQKGPWDVSPRQ